MSGNTDYYGHFTCPPPDDDQSQFSLVGTRLYYQHYYLNNDGDLIGTHPGALHKFDKRHFCFINHQVK